MKKHLRSIMLLGLAALLMTAAAAAGVPAADCECEPCGEWQSLPLYAGQDWEVGEVLVNNCEDKIAVQYVLFDEIAAEGWGLTEVHLSIGDALADIPQNKGKNPVPGQFAINEKLDGVAASEVYCFEMDGREAGDAVLVAAHAVVEKTEVTVLQEAPYGGSLVAAYTQGLQKSGAPVLVARSVPETVLTWDTARAESDFFSLGFGGEITIEFDCCVTNGDGPDVLLVEDTWGTYPAETAEVYASADGIDWFLLGTADNATRDATNNWQTVAQFELGELAFAKYIRVVDTTDPAPLPANADGYDLNAVVALHDCTETTVYSETTWGGMLPFAGANWATYGMYTIQECVQEPVLVQELYVPANAPAGVTSNALVAGSSYLIEASGTWKFVNWATPEDPELGYADAKYSRRLPLVGAPNTEVAWVSGDDLSGSWKNYLELMVNGGVVDWGDFNPGHVYTATVVSDGSPIALTIMDNAYGDNVGGLTVRIYELP